MWPWESSIPTKAKAMGGNRPGRTNGKTGRGKEHHGKVWYLRCYWVEVDENYSNLLSWRHTERQKDFKNLAMYVSMC